MTLHDIHCFLLCNQLGPPTKVACMSIHITAKHALMDHWHSINGMSVLCTVAYNITYQHFIALYIPHVHDTDIHCFLFCNYLDHQPRSKAVCHNKQPNPQLVFAVDCLNYKLFTMHTGISQCKPSWMCLNKDHALQPTILNYSPYYIVNNWGEEHFSAHGEGSQE